MVVLCRPYTETLRTIPARLLYRPGNNMLIMIPNVTSKKVLIHVFWSGCVQHVSNLQVKFLGLVYVVFIPSHSPGHFGNSNPSLRLITHTTHSTSGPGLAEWLICRAFYCSHIVGVVNECVAVYCFVVVSTQYYSHQRLGVLIWTSYNFTSSQHSFRGGKV